MSGVEYLPVQHDDDGDHASCGYDVAPVMDNEITGNDLKGNKCRLEYKEIVTGRNSKGFIDISASKANEGR